MYSLLDADVDSADELLEMAAGAAAAGVVFVGSVALNNAQRNREGSRWVRPIFTTTY